MTKEPARLPVVAVKAVHPAHANHPVIQETSGAHSGGERMAEKWYGPGRGRGE